MLSPQLTSAVAGDPTTAPATDGALALNLPQAEPTPATFFGEPIPDHDQLRRRWLPADPEGLPPTHRLRLAGPRRQKEGRGGATALVDTIRTVVRCPLLYDLDEQFPRQVTGRPSPPAAYWFFYGSIARDLRSFSLADREIEAHYDVVGAEFAAHGIRLPPARPGTTNPVPGYAAYNRWRNTHVLKAGRLQALLDRFAHSSLELALLIREAEGRATGDPLDPSLGEILSGDATVFRPPSDVREETCWDEKTQLHITTFPGSRARTAETEAQARAGRGRTRPHEQGGDYRSAKKHGPTEGFYHLALSTKGYDTYTRVILDVNIAKAGEAESTAAMPMLDRVLAAAPNHFQAIAYDGQIYPKHALELLKRHGSYVVNHNSLRSHTRKDEGDGTDRTAGITIRQQGQHRGKKVKTYSTPLPSQHHQRADGTLCTHHLVSDDGAVYPADRAAGNGTQAKAGPLLSPAALRRLWTENGYRVELEYAIPCPHGDLTYRARLTDTKPQSDGHVAWSSPLAAHRVIPAAWEDRFACAFGARNQSESVYSWLEQRYYHKDRVASWGREAQLVDLLCAAILHNAEAWAHYVYRYGGHR